MSGVFYLAWRYILWHRWKSAILVAAVTLVVYLPLARTALVAERFGVEVRHFPLTYYRGRSFYVMRTDALDRLGTQLEQRFTRTEVSQMMAAAGLERITFSDRPPFWCAVGYRRQAESDAVA